MAYRSGSTLAYVNTAAPAIPVPAGAAVDDIAVLDLWLQRTGTQVTAIPTGFILDAALIHVGSTRLWVHYQYWKRLTAADSGNYTFTLSAAQDVMGVCSLYSGRITTGSPFDVTTVTATAPVGTDTAVNAPTTEITTVNDQCDLVWTAFPFSAAAAADKPASFTQAAFNAVSVIQAYKAAHPTGSSGSLVQGTLRTDQWTVFLSALMPTGATPVTPPIILRGMGISTGATDLVTAINPVVPAGTTTGDLSVLTVAMKPYNATITTPSGWTKIGEDTNGTVANAGDVGSTKVAVFVRESATPGAIGNLTLGGSPNTVGAVIHSYAKTSATATWDYSQFTTGGDTTNGANYSATGAGGLDVAAGDYVFAGTAVNADLGTVAITAHTIGGMSGATAAATSPRTTGTATGDGLVTTGNDCRVLAADQAILSGTSSAAPTYAYTLAANLTSGTTLWVRLRAVSASAPTAVKSISNNRQTVLRRAANW